MLQLVKGTVSDGNSLETALSHKMKHPGRADRATTGITADAVILLANILRRLHDA